MRFGYRRGSHAVKRILAENSPAPVTAPRYPRHRRIADSAEARLAIFRLYSEGWNKKSIAAYLHINRDTVHAVLRRWITEGVAGLDDRSSAPRHSVRKTDFTAIVAVKEVREIPELGAFRIHLSPRICGGILALNRKLYGLSGPPAKAKETKPMPFAAQRRHHYWTVAIRHIDVAHVDGKVYRVSFPENYSRAILASGVFPTQDLSAHLMVLYATIRQHCIPETLVSDSGAVVVTTKQAKAVYAALGIEKREIERQQLWQRSIETNFNVQRRMADWDFAKATTWAELLAIYDLWEVNFNEQSHWAHQECDDERRSPRHVLGWAGEQRIAPEELHRVFYRTRFGMKLDQLGYLRFRHWRVYGEQGLG